MILLAPALMRLERNFVERWLRAYFCVIERGEQNKGASLSHDLCRFCPNQGESMNRNGASRWVLGPVWML